MNRQINLHINRFCITVIIAVMTFISFSETSYSAIFFDSGAYVAELKARVDRVAPGIVRIVAYDDTGTESGSGSGFFIDNGGLILTNAYIFKNAHSAEVFTDAGRYADVAILREEESSDLALIKIDTANDTALEIDFEYEPVPDKKLTVIGRSQNIKITASEGMTQIIKPVSETLELIMVRPLPTMGFQTADSGPAIAPDNKVIGISTKRSLENTLFGHDAIDTEGLIRIISADTIKTFLSGTSESKQLKTAKSRDIFKWSQKQAMSIFIFLYTMGFQKILNYFIVIILVISLGQWIYYRLKRTSQPSRK